MVHGQIRASDAERDAVAARLHAAAAEGRLEPDELDERVSDSDFLWPVVPFAGWALATLWRGLPRLTA